MNIAAHNPKFLNGLSITRLLSRIAILTSQLDGAKQITTMTSQIMDLTNRCNSRQEEYGLDQSKHCLFATILSEVPH